MRCPSLFELPPAAGRAGWPWSEESQRLAGTTADGRPWPRVSVVTPTFNQRVFLEETMRSVLLQGYPDLEYLVMDGGSTDGSVEVILRYADRLAYWVSRPDGGQSQALNAGLRKATGEVLGWLNGDDTYEPGAVSEAARVFAADPAVVMAYGDCANVDGAGTVFSVSRSRPFDYDRLLRRWPNFIAQPTVFLRREALAAVGGLDESLEFAMDYDLWLRVARLGRAVYIPRIQGRFRVHPDSKTTRHPDRFWPEVRRVSRRHGGGFLSPMLVTHLRDEFYLWRQRVRHRWVG